jgi:hypothetical protein
VSFSPISFVQPEPVFLSSRDCFRSIDVPKKLDG